MQIVLPKERAGLAAVESLFAEGRLDPALDGLPGRTAEVEISLPKFRLEGSFALGETLQNMGCPMPFLQG